MTIAALSLWEPWASLMRCGVKTIETRSWWPPRAMCNRPLLICAAKKWTNEQQDFLWRPEVQRALCDADKATLVPSLRIYGQSQMLLGKAACIVTLRDAAWTQDVKPPDQERQFGNYGTGRVAWITSDVRSDFEPFPVRGQQGLFQVELPEGITLLGGGPWP